MTERDEFLRRERNDPFGAPLGFGPTASYNGATWAMPKGRSLGKGPCLALAAQPDRGVPAIKFATDDPVAV
jgi:hypothetical protein